MILLLSKYEQVRSGASILGMACLGPQILGWDRGG